MDVFTPKESFFPLASHPLVVTGHVNGTNFNKEKNIGVKNMFIVKSDCTSREQLVNLKYLPLVSCLQVICTKIYTQLVFGLPDLVVYVPGLGPNLSLGKPEIKF